MGGEEMVGRGVTGKEGRKGQKEKNERTFRIEEQGK